MKEGWTYKKLGDLCDFQGGSQPPKSEWSTIQKDGFVRMLQIRDFTKSRNCEKEYVKLTNKLRFCEESDILIGRYGASVGKILTGLEGAYNVAIIKSIPNETIISKKYIRYYFESPLFQNFLLKICSSRTAQAGFSKDDISELKVPLPSDKTEQQRIVSFLDAHFAKIDAIKANAEKKLQEAKALLDKSITEFILYREGWNKSKLKDLCSITGEYGLNESAIEYNGIRYLRITDITANGNLNDDKVSCANITGKTQAKLEEGDILFARTGATVGKTLVYREEFGDCNFAGYLIRYRTNPNIIIPQYLFYFTHSSEYYKWVSKNQAVAAQPNISAQKYNLLEIHYPTSIKEQYSIVNKLDRISEKIRQLQSNYSQTVTLCEDLKISLLKDIFS